MAILHEKPLAGVNGSGKHLNWSIGDNTGANYLEPSKSPLKNISFLMTIGAVLLGVNKFGGLLRAAVADAGNDHRLGANEAPPAIMSVYLGEYLNRLFDEIEGLSTFTEKQITQISLGIQNIPRVAKDMSDRNRTSPLAFTGNKFEFRAVGSSQNCGEAATVINLLVAYGYDEIYNRVHKRKGNPRSNAMMVFKEILEETKRIRFEGNNYSAEWHKEAEVRGLPNAKNTPTALKTYLEEDVASLFERYKVLSRRELESKVEIKLESYVNLKLIEFKTAGNIVNTMILPALTRNISRAAGALSSVKAVGLSGTGMNEDVTLLDKLYNEIRNAANALKEVVDECYDQKDLHYRAHLCSEKGVERLAQLRDLVDRAEEAVDNELWPLAKYQDLLNEL